MRKRAGGIAEEQCRSIDQLTQALLCDRRGFLAVEWRNLRAGSCNASWGFESFADQRSNAAFALKD
jgi:hypothetical protein